MKKAALAVSKNKSKMPQLPEAWQHAKVSGDAGTYKVWALDWLNHRVALDRAGEIDWVHISRITFVNK